MAYRAISWNPNEVLAGSKMDTLTNNMDYLYNYTPRAQYTLPSGLNRVEGVRLVSGRATIGPQKSDNGAVTVNFANAFSTGCQPIIVATPVTNKFTKIFCTIQGIGQIVPDNRGFVGYVNVASEIKSNDKITQTIYLTWMAMGY